MSVLRGRLLVAVAICAVAWSSSTGASSTAPPSTPVIASSTPPPIASVSTCPSRTINFITETLPQQCLRTDWSRNATTSAQVQDEGTVTTNESHSRKDASESRTESGAESSTLLGHEGAVSGSITGEHIPSSSLSSEGPTAASSEAPAATQVSDEAGEQEDDPLSDAANFVSFEEWKAKMLEKAGQSPENLGGERRGSDGEGRPPPIHQALDSFEDDGEIELDFAGFVDPDTVASALPSAKITRPEEPPDTEPDAVAAGASTRSKNAGTTSKDRTNYASLDCAAQILKTNSECKGANSILQENKDNYMLNPCSAKNKFFIVELCSDILIDTIALANYEFFSSTFRQVRFSISDQYPVKLDKWRELGVFEAQNRRGVQAFLIENGLIWGRYLRLEFLGHYGSEYYCPVSVLRVHGKTMMDDYRSDFKSAKGDDEIEAGTPADALKVIQHQQAEKGVIVVPNKNAQENTADSKSAIIVDYSPSGTESTVPHATVSKVAAFPLQNCRGPGSFNDTCPRTNYYSPLIEQVDLVTSSCHKSAKFCNMELTKRIHAVSRAVPRNRPTATPPPVPHSNDGEASKASKSVTGTPEKSTSIGTIDSDPKQSIRSDNTANQSSPSQDPTTSRPQSAQSDSDVDANIPSGSSSIENATANTSTQTSTRTPVQQAPAATPSTQESFFKSVHKRLQLLEANSTLSLQYIEEQSRLLREAFTKVEKRQLSKTTSFLASLNETVLSELREFRTQYDQIWQSTILELSSQREQTLKEAGALSVRLAILADEVVWQKRLVYLQFGLILLCLAFFVFAQGSAGGDGLNYLELPVLRDMITRSPYASRHGRMRPRAGTGISIRSDDRGPLESPLSSPSRPISRSGLTWARSPARSDDDAIDEPVSKLDDKSHNMYRLPTPPSEEDVRPNGLLQVPPLHTASDQAASDPEPEVLLRRAISSPALGLEEGEQVDDEGEPTTPIEPPRVAELARDAERSPGSEMIGAGVTTPTSMTSDGDTVL